MAQETVRLAEYAAALRYEDLPAEIVRRAKDCIADTVAAIIGQRAAVEPDRHPLCRAHRARRQEPHPRQPGAPVQAHAAALANGALAHAFELDA